MARKGLLERVNDRARGVQVKGFTEAPFWALDTAQYPWWNAATPTQERIENDFIGYVNGAYKGDGIVFSCIDRRQQVFSQGRFQWRNYTNGQPGKLFGSSELGLLEKPWPTGTTGELLAYMEIVASIAGNAYLTTVSKDGSIGNASKGKPGRWISRLRPDWMTLVIDAVSGDPWGIDAYVAGFLYQPRVYGSTPSAHPAQLLMPDEVCHYSPKPDPGARFRGMSWLTPTIKEIQGDMAATDHKLGFFRRGATPSLVVKGIPASSPEEFERLVTMMEAKHAGVDNAYRTLYLTAGADAAALGADLKQLDFKVTQGGGEVRLAVAGGVPASILGISEGLSGSSLNAGNFGAARRLFVDTTIQDLWSKVAPSMQVLVDTPPNAPNAVLAIDDRNIPFLREDAKDDAEIRSLNAMALRQLTDAGWDPDAAVDYINTNDVGRLSGAHSGLHSVQLLPPGSPSSPPRLSSNGSGTITDPAMLAESTSSN
jgi:hypothetical protein